jgi:hypothetical protein
MRIPLSPLVTGLDAVQLCIFVRSPLLSTTGCGWMPPGLGDQQMRILMIIALSATLAGCTGDRVKQAQSPGTTPLLILTA